MLWARPSPEADFWVAGASGGIFRLAGVGAISIAGLLCVFGAVQPLSGNACVLSQPPRWSQPCPNLQRRLGHEKPFKNKGVPNLTPWSQPFATHSCGRTEKVGNMLFYTKREGPPLGTPRLGPHLFK